jgi:hypothetical protein
MPDLIDAFRRFVKPYRGPELTLYRGELESRHAKDIRGIAWTPNLATAKMFAHRRMHFAEGFSRRITDWGNEGNDCRWGKGIHPTHR